MLFSPRSQAGQRWGPSQRSTRISKTAPRRSLIAPPPLSALFFFAYLRTHLRFVAQYRADRSTARRHRRVRPMSKSPQGRLDAILVLQEPGQAPSRIPLHEIITVGRHESNHVAIQDVAASRHHLLIYRAGKGIFRLVDLRSTNGTFLNGKKASEALLTAGDLLRVGATKLTFTLPTPEDQRRATFSAMFTREHAAANPTAIQRLDAYLSQLGHGDEVRREIAALALAALGVSFSDDSTEDQWTNLGDGEIELDSEDVTAPFELKVDLEFLDD